MAAVPAYTWTEDLHAFVKKVWAKHKDVDSFDMGAYQDMRLEGSSANVAGICHVYELMVLMLDRCPSGVINRVTLRTALEAVADKVPACKTMGCSQAMSTHRWADWLADKIRVVLSHIRRMKRNVKQWQSRKKRATAAQVVCIEDLMGRYLPDQADRHEPLGSVACSDGVNVTCRPKPPIPLTPMKRQRAQPGMEDECPSAPPKKIRLTWTSWIS